MGYSLRDMSNARKFSSSLTVDALQQAIPAAAIRAVLDSANAHERRERKLNMVVTVWLVIAMHLYSSLALDAVFGKLAKGLRSIWPDPDVVLPSASALTYRRYQLGARPLAHLFHLVCRPLATPDTPGAFRFGLRLMAIDGTTEDLPDSAANARYFGRHHGARGDAAFPHVQAVYLGECGTHAIVDAGFWPLSTHERMGGRRLLRALKPDMLLLWDAGFHSYDQLAAARTRGAHVLGRLPATVKPHLVKILADGSHLARLVRRDKQGRPTGEELLVRIVSYTVTDPQLVGFGQTHRIVTTRLDPLLAPARELAAVYHERWESERTIDELDTHQRLAGRVVRSQSPLGVMQALYGLLLAQYAVRVLMHQAAQQAALDPARLRFVHALELVRDAIAEFQMTQLEQIPALLGRLLRDIAAKQLPDRRARVNPRVVKRKMSNFKLKRSEHRPSVPLQQPFHRSLALI